MLQSGQTREAPAAPVLHVRVWVVVEVVEFLPLMERNMEMMSMSVVGSASSSAIGKVVRVGERVELA